MELKIVIRQAWKTAVITVFLTAVLLVEFLFSIQFVLDKKPLKPNGFKGFGARGGT